MSSRLPMRLAAVIVLALLASACHSRSEPEVSDAIAVAADACSGLSQEAELVNCQARLYVARDVCTQLSPTERLACSDSLDELSRAAIEGYHVARRECEQLTSEVARTMCRGNAATPTTTAEALAPTLPLPAAAEEVGLPAPTAEPVAEHTAGAEQTARPSNGQPAVVAPPGAEKKASDEDDKGHGPGKKEKPR